MRNLLYSEKHRRREASFHFEIYSGSLRRVQKSSVMFKVLLFSTVLVIGVVGLPPVIVRQPVESKIFFKTSLSKPRSFMIECEADGDPKPE